MKLALARDDSMLFTADHVGFIYVYNVKQYALGPEQNPPESKASPHFVCTTQSMILMFILSLGVVLFTSRGKLLACAYQQHH